MSGQVNVTIGEKEWPAGLATDYWEQVQGLGGVPGITPESGMPFAMGFEQVINVTTEPMLFLLKVHPHMRGEDGLQFMPVLISGGKVSTGQQAGRGDSVNGA